MTDRILAIDPGPVRHAWALLSGDAARPELRAWGYDLISEWTNAVAHAPSDIVCEMIASYGMPIGQEVIDTCVQIGVLVQMVDGRIPFRRLTRVQVKTSVCRSARATDANVRQAVIDRFGGPTAIRKGGQLYKVSKDVWAAIAVGLAAMDPEVRWYEETKG